MYANDNDSLNKKHWQVPKLKRQSPKGPRVNIVDALEASCDEVNYVDFYRDIFPVGSFEQKGVLEDGKYNGVAVIVRTGQKHARRLIITDDLEGIDEMAATDDFCLMSPISYAGRSRKSINARFLYAITIDLDGVETLNQWQFFLEQIEKGELWNKMIWGLPTPTYLVASGTGLHIYYVFERPIPLFKNIVKQLEVLKRRLTWQAWTQGASSLSETPQYESLFQGFRVVGTITKNADRCRAFKFGEKVTVEYLNKFVPEKYRAKDFTYKSELTLKEAQKKYPEWYQNRIVEKRPRKTWTCKKDLYDWWIRDMIPHVEQGHRYWTILTLATYAKKCNVPFETLEKDAYGLIPFMNTRGDAFTEDDVMNALEAFSDSYITYPIHAITERTGLHIDRNKRNGRKQIVHLKRIRYMQDYDDPERSWRNKNGQPKKQETVLLWQYHHRNGRMADCIRETGLSKKTVIKWWNSAKLKYACEDREEELGVKYSGNGGRPTEWHTVARWRREHPEGRKIECERETGLSRHTVIKWWNDFDGERDTENILK